MVSARSCLWGGRMLMVVLNIMLARKFLDLRGRQHAALSQPHIQALRNTGRPAHLQDTMHL